MYIYIYIYYVLFSPVKSESGIIPSGQKRSEEVLLFLVLLIHINTHNKMEINS